MTYVDGLLLVVGDGLHDAGNPLGQLKGNVGHAVFVTDLHMSYVAEWVVSWMARIH